MHKHRFKAPLQNYFFRILTTILSCHRLLKLRRYIMRYLPFLKLKSEVHNVVYLSWLVDVDQLKNHFPKHVPLWEKNGKTIFTILSYQHQHFGFAFFHWLRSLFPSPKQSNWRFYLDSNTHPQTVIFEQVLMDQWLYILAGRLFSDVMPAQFCKIFQHNKEDLNSNTPIHTKIFLDQNYHLESKIHITEEKRLPNDWTSLFPTWDSAINFLVEQNFAWSEWVDQANHFSQGEIHMPIDAKNIQPAKIQTLIPPTLLKQWNISEDQQPLAFIISKLDFNVLAEKPL